VVACNARTRTPEPMASTCSERTGDPSRRRFASAWSMRPPQRPPTPTTRVATAAGRRAAPVVEKIGVGHYHNPPPHKNTPPTPFPPPQHKRDGRSIRRAGRARPRAAKRGGIDRGRTSPTTMSTCSRAARPDFRRPSRRRSPWPAAGKPLAESPVAGSQPRQPIAVTPTECAWIGHGPYPPPAFTEQGRFEGW